MADTPFITAQQAVIRRELYLKERELTLELEAQKKMTSHATAVAMGLVRNVEYRNNTFGSEPEAFGQWGRQSGGPFNKTEEHSAQ